MIIHIGTITDDKRKISKKFTIQKKINNAEIFSPCSYLDPIFIVSSSLVESYTNYVWCDDFNRYYYVTDIVQKGDIAEIHCHVDVLMSYSQSILSLQANVARQEFTYNNKYIDDKIMATCKRRIHFYDCGTTPFATNGTGQPVVLTVSGGAS